MIHQALHERLKSVVILAKPPHQQYRGAIIDSQSVKTTELGRDGKCRGFDAHKKVKGRKRHIVTDTIGMYPNPLGVKVVD